MCEVSVFGVAWCVCGVVQCAVLFVWFYNLVSCGLVIVVGVVCVSVQV